LADEKLQAMSDLSLLATKSNSEWSALITGISGRGKQPADIPGSDTGGIRGE